MKKNLFFLRRTKQTTILVCSAMISCSQLVKANVRVAPAAMESYSKRTAQQLGSVTGNVTDKDGMKLIGASVKVVGTNQTVATDNNGDFKFQLAPGTYTLEVSYISFKTQ